MVDTPEDPQFKRLFKVASINALTNTLIDFDDNITQADYCEGIALTTEILTAYGFKNEGDEKVTWQVLENEVVNFVGAKNNGIIEVYLDMIPHVRVSQFHQLQNIYFDLIGEELELH